MVTEAYQAGANFGHMILPIVLVCLGIYLGTKAYINHRKKRENGQETKT